MKLACYLENEKPRLGVYSDGGIIAVTGALADAYPSIRAVIEKDGFQDIAAWADGKAPDVGLDDAHYLPPLHDAEKVICVGVNYPKRHPVHGDMPPPENISIFNKWEGALVGHLQPLIQPPGAAAETFDYEGELVLVIGPGGPGVSPEDFPCRAVAKQDAFNVIAGYTIMNDGSVRDWQKHSVPAGKNFTGSGASGPCFVTADEIDDPFKMQLSTRLNGEEVQSATPADMIFDIPTIIHYVSTIVQLKPGDIISTGSPSGSGGSRQPQRFLVPGDELEIEWSGVGCLRNKVQGKTG
ncbi:MAG: fumarylacetoacetate hydrolase family protein [Proteobacteria bacterium]|nr:fumarylacetoacetate hydrolase family protein [Pseudomonadota bacterium]